jgi:hypothetical protein
MQRRLQDIRDDEIKARPPMVRRLGAELDYNRMSVQICVRLGTRQRDGIDVRPDNQASTASPGDPGKQARTGSNIQNRFWLTLPAKQVHGCGTQTRGRVRSVPKHGGKAWRLR